MSKIVARMEKMKTGNLGGIQRHNQRETDNHSNKEIDVERSHLNYDLVNQESINYQERIREIIDEQRVSKRAVRKDAVLVDEWIITSDKTFFETADSRKFFEDSLAYFSDRCGSQNIAYATVHLDETTPHMHLGIVPMYNNRLSSKQMFTREALKEIQEELPTYLKERGHEIERGIKGSEQKHLTVEEYKENQREVERMAEKVSDLELKAQSFDYEIQAKQTQVDELAQQTWHDDWLATKQELPDFVMTIPVAPDSSKRIEVNKDTAKEYNLNFREVFQLFQEKYKQVKDYVAQKWQKLTRKELELEGKRESIKEREKLLEAKLGRLNAEVYIKENQNKQLTELVNAKTRYVEQLASSSQLATMLPEYVKPAKLNKDVWLVPKDKWEAKHISANAVNDMLNIKQIFTQLERRIYKQAEGMQSAWELQNENAKLRKDISKLGIDNQKFEGAFVELLLAEKLDIDTVKQLDMPDNIKQTLGVMPKETELYQDFEGPDMEWPSGPTL